MKQIRVRRGLRSVHVKKNTKPLIDNRKVRGDGYPNVEITQPLVALSSDISYIPTGEGFSYLCQIKDIHTNAILAACQSERMSKAPVVDTIRAAKKRWQLPEGAIFHSDRVSQYTSDAVSALLRQYGMRQSFSRVGMPGDNAWSESFLDNEKGDCPYPAL